MKRKKNYFLMEIIAPGWMKSKIINQMETFSTARIVFVLGGEFLHKISQSANIIPFLEWYFNKRKIYCIAIILSQRFSKFKCYRRILRRDISNSGVPHFKCETLHI